MPSTEHYIVRQNRMNAINQALCSGQYDEAAHLIKQLSPSLQRTPAKTLVRLCLTFGQVPQAKKFATEFNIDITHVTPFKGPQSWWQGDWPR